MKHAPDIPPAIEQPARVPKLSDAQREWIVRRLAVQDSPTAVRRDVRERFGIAVSRRAIAHYDPTRDPQRSKRWVDLFCTVRRDHAGSSADNQCDFIFEPSRLFGQLFLRARRRAPISLWHIVKYLDRVTSVAF